MPTIDTGKVTDRRILRFNTLADVRAELDRVDAAIREGRARTLGNWTLGQILGHLAAWVGYAYTGPPKKAPAPVRWMSRLMRNRFIHKPMPVGFRIPSVAEGTFATEDMAAEEGMRRLLDAIDRLERQNPGPRHPMFGPMVHDDWIQLNLRHAELHLGFIAI